LKIGRTPWVTTRPAQKPQQQQQQQQQQQHHHFFKILCADMCADDQHCTIGAGHFAAKIFQDYVRLFI